MSYNNQNRAACKQSSGIRFTYACLVFTLILFTSFLAIAVCVTVSVIKRDPPEAQCPDPNPAPSFLQIQVLGDSGGDNDPPKGQTGNPADTRKCENVTHAVTVNMEKPPWVDELLKSLNGVALIDPDKNEWIKDMVDALQQIQKKINDDNGIRYMVIDPEKNQALIKALQSIVVASDCGNSNQSGTTTSSQGTADASNIEQRLRQRIRQKMCCNKVAFSEYIHFPTGQHSIETAEKGKITEFMRSDGARATKWGVFGFASEAGRTKRNLELSWQRACNVKKYICENNDRLQCTPDCEKYPEDKVKKEKAGHQCVAVSEDSNSNFPICFLGEQHFINGVADSRSVVIAACKAME